MGCLCRAATNRRPPPSVIWRIVCRIPISWSLFMRRTVFATVALALVLPLAAQAQEWPPQPAKYTNVAWYEIVNFDFAGPNAEAATDAFMDVFVPAIAASGIRAFEHSTGEWDITLIIPMESPGDLEWDMAPSEAVLGS